MATSKAAFDKAVADSKNLPEKPDNATLLKLYAYYKQSTAGAPALPTWSAAPSGMRGTRSRARATTRR